MFERKDPIFKKPLSEPETPTAGPTAPSHAAVKKTVFIGQSIFIKGELTGNEDLTIEGRVEGNIELKDHNLIIGASGRIQARLFAKNITIMGEVHGDVYAEEKVEIAKTGKLKGNIIAPRVVIEDGARFKGSVEMETEKRSAAEAYRKKNGRDKAPEPSLPVDGGKVAAG